MPIEILMWYKQTKWTVPKKEAKTHILIKKLLSKKDNVVNAFKQTKSVFKSDYYDNANTFNTSIEDILRNEKIEEVHIIGLDTNDCVLATAYEAFDLGYFTYVIEEGTQSSSGNGLHMKAIDLLRHVGLSNYSDYKKIKK